MNRAFGTSFNRAYHIRSVEGLKKRNPPNRHFHVAHPFHGPGGRRLDQYKLVVGASAITFTTEFTNVFFGGKLIYRNQHTGGSVYPSAIVTDRAGSVVSAGPYQNRSYYPYGEEKGTPTANGADKFATYYRDEHTEFDYAMQRYYHSGSSRFTSPDPYRASGGPADPSSWNRYAYVQGDPVNFLDPEGLLVESVEEFMFCVNAPWTGPWGWKCGKRIFDEKYWILQADGSTTARGGGGVSPPNRWCDRDNPTNAKVLDFIQANDAAAHQLSRESGLPADFILAWAGYESNYGRGSAATKNNNFFGLTAPNGGTGGWTGAIECTAGAFGGFACFPADDGNNLLLSGHAALTSQHGRYLNPALSAAKRGGGIDTIANAIAEAGFNSEYSDGEYGKNVLGTASAIGRRRGCL